MKYILWIVSLLSTSYLSAQHGLSASTVRVYGVTQNNKAKGGTGFAVSIRGRKYIATCYHVINGTSKVEVYSIALKKIINCKIVAYDDIKDLALLSASEVSGIPAIELSDLPSGLVNLKGIAIGNPDNNNEFQLDVKFTSESGIIPSRNFRDNNGQSVFSNSDPLSFSLIPINSTIYGGMSGAPIIVNGSAIGVISGSINTGGSIGWGIPIGYLVDMSINNNGYQGLSLGSLRSLSPSNRNLSRALLHDEDAGDDFEPLADEITIINNTYEEMLPNIEVATDVVVYGLKLLNKMAASTNLQTINTLASQFNANVDSVDFFKNHVMTLLSKFNTSRSTFTEVFAKIKEIYNADEDAIVDEQMEAALQKDLKPLDTREELYRIKFINKSTEFTTAYMAINIYTIDQNEKIYKNLSAWKAYIETVREYLKTIQDYYGVLHKQLNLYKIYTDLIYESLAYKKDS